MKRHALTAMLAMAISGGGCARARSVLPPGATRRADDRPVEMTPLEPITTSINEKKIPADLNTVRASYEVEGPDSAALRAPKGAPPALTVAAASIETPPPEEAPPALPSLVAQAPARVSPPPVERPVSVPVERPAQPAPSGANAIPLRTETGLDPGKPAARTAAIVGNTFITYRELKTALCLRLKCKPHELQQIPRENLNQMAKDTLDSLIDRTLLLQEAKRDMKKPQQWAMFTSYVEKQWAEKEIPPLLRKEGVEDELGLRRKLEAQGESLDDLKDAFKTETMSREILMMRVQPKVERPGLPEMKLYYAQHKDDPEFHRDANVKWHEILIPVAQPTDLDSARKTAAAARARLLAGEDFAKVARSVSAGVTASKGGAWDTSPDGYPVPAVNAALASLPIGQVSPPIESPKGIHVVRVDSRHGSGPASFVETQKQIAEAIFQKRFTSQIEVYLKKLRDRTPVSSPMFEGTATAPSLANQKAKTDSEARPASVR